MSDEKCPHCDHDLRGHRGQRPVYDARMVFVCACGCSVDGCVHLVEASR